MYIGVVGSNGVGKSSVCHFLTQKGFVVISLSDVVRQEVLNRGLSLDRDTLTTVANELKSTHGKAYLAEQAVQDVQGFEKVVFDSVRHLDELHFLQSKGAFFIGLEADSRLRYERIQSRQSDRDQIDYETFLRHDEREMDGQSLGQNIQACLDACDVRLENNGDLDSLKIAIEGVLP